MAEYNTQIQAKWIYMQFVWSLAHHIRNYNVFMEISGQIKFP